MMRFRTKAAGSPHSGWGGVVSPGPDGTGYSAFGPRWKAETAGSGPEMRFGTKPRVWPPNVAPPDGPLARLTATGRPTGRPTRRPPLPPPARRPPAHPDPADPTGLASPPTEWCQRPRVPGPPTRRPIPGLRPIDRPKPHAFGGPAGPGPPVAHQPTGHRPTSPTGPQPPAWPPVARPTCLTGLPPTAHRPHLPPGTSPAGGGHQVPVVR